MSIKKEAQKTFLQVPSSKLLVARIDDDVAKSMPNIHQSIPSSALVRNKGMPFKYGLLLNIIYRNMKSVYAILYRKHLNVLLKNQSNQSNTS